MIDETGQRILRLIDVHKDQIIAFAEDIAAHPEPGYEEFRTAGKTAEVLKNLGYKVTEHLARTGVKGTKSIKEGPSLTVIGELDAIGCHSHPNANPVTGVAHACGHHAQMAAMIGCAIAMADPDVQKCLAGTVNFLAVPAEEYIDADKRARLKKEGIEFCCGKSEMIRTGVFDDTDIALTTHVHMVPVEEDFYLGNPACNGYSAERVTVRGKAAHGAIDPWNGVNALSITTSAIQMMGLMRETFREEDHVRLHNVIRKAGDVINSVPDEAIVETKVRAASLDKICEITDMVNRAYAGSAYAFGGKIEMEKLQGYMPIIPRAADNALIEAADDLGLNYRTVQKGDFNNACTDVGDLSHLVPVVNFTFKGFEGKLHGADFKITDPEKAMRSYPHELSGGMRQRVMIAMAMSSNPKVLIADEPTTALDVTIQAQILHLLLELQKKNNMSIILITHDLGVVAQTCKRVAVMCGGYVVEEGTVEEIFLNPGHPYTQALIASMPRVGGTFEQFLERDLSDGSGNLCPFLNRCKYADKTCEACLPKYYESSEEHKILCHRREEEK